MYTDAIFRLSSERVKRLLGRTQALFVLYGHFPAF